MKKAVLLLAMVTVAAGCIYLKNADRDTVLYEQQVMQAIQYADVPVAECTEETISEEPICEDPVKEEAAYVDVSEEKSEEESPTSEVANAGQMTGVYYGKLSQNEQIIYSEVLASLLAFEEETTLSTTDSNVIDKAFTCVMLDYPGIFYVDGYKYTEYTYDNEVKKIVFAGNYLYDKEETEQRQSLIETRVAEILSGMPDTQDEYEKVKYLYDTLVMQTEYDIHAADNQNICSVFLDGRSVCQGYAKALQYLANKAGITCSLVLGNVIGGEGHAWNLVSVNGAWYYLDATWGDAYYLFGSQGQTEKKQTSVINYDYLCVTTEQLLLTHNPDMPVELPECVSVTDNYYVREGLYFTGYDEEKLADIFLQAIEDRKETVTVKCSDGAVYDEMCQILLEEQKIFEFIESDGTVAYTDNREQGILTFWLFEGRY